MQVGARSIAFPRLAQYSVWAWLFGNALVTISLLANGGPGGGSEKMVDLFLLGMGIAVIGALAAAVSVVTTVLTNRAPGMTLLRVPMSSWSALTGGVALISYLASVARNSCVSLRRPPLCACGLWRKQRYFRLDGLVTNATTNLRLRCNGCRSSC